MKTQRNPNYGKFIKPEGYKDLGWQVHAGNCDEIKKCHELGHNYKNGKREFDNSLFQRRGTEIIYICDKCKIFWHIDMSD